MRFGRATHDRRLSSFGLPLGARLFPQLDRKGFATHGQRDAAAPDIAEALGDALRGDVFRINAGDDGIDRLRGEGPVLRNACGLGGITVTPMFFGELPADLEPRPSFMAQHAGRADERTVGFALHRPEAVAAQIPMADGGGEGTPGIDAALRAADEAADFGVGGDAREPLEILRAPRAQDQTFGLKAGDGWHYFGFVARGALNLATSLGFAITISSRKSSLKPKLVNPISLRIALMQATISRLCFRTSSLDGELAKPNILLNAFITDGDDQSTKSRLSSNMILLRVASSVTRSLGRPVAVILSSKNNPNSIFRNLP